MKRLTAVLLCMIMVLSFAACGGDSGNSDQGSGDSSKAVEYKVDPEATTLTVSDGKTQKEYTADELKKLGTEKNTYSGRNKKVQNARIFEEYEGVDLKTLMKDAGFKTDGASFKVVCSDGYTREYYVDDLYGKYAFEDNDSDKKKKVDPVIAVVEQDEDSEYPSPFKLVYGQADYDTYTNDSQDYNVQGWGSYIQYIEVSYK